MMVRRALCTAAASLMLLHGVAAATEVKVMIPPPVREALNDLIPRFEQASGSAESSQADLQQMGESIRQLEEALELVELTPYAAERVAGYSTGMRQRLGLALALLNKPGLLILDEPFSGLDPVNMELLKDCILELNRSGTTILFSTHDMHVAEKMCDMVPTDQPLRFNLALVLETVAVHRAHFRSV